MRGKDKTYEVSLIEVNNIIVVTYCSECHRLSLSLLAVNEITLIGRPFSQSWLFYADVSHNEQNAALVLQSVRRTL